jgi:phosphoribosylformylglycinamidine cyclo-ligase
VPALKPVLNRIHAMAHITGGGLPGNLNRALPPGLDADVDTSTWQIPSLFRVLGDAGQVDRIEQFRAFNMGVGMVVIASRSDAPAIMQSASAAGVRAWELGRLVPGSGKVRLDGAVT